MKLLNGLLWIILKNTRRYDRLKSDEEKKQSSQSLGVWSILSTVIGTICVVLSVWAISAMADKLGAVDSLEVLLIIFGLFLLVVLLVGLFLQLIVNGIICAILQMKLNKKPIGLISLILWLAIIVAAVVIVALVIF